MMLLGDAAAHTFNPDLASLKCYAPQDFVWSYSDFYEMGESKQIQIKITLFYINLQIKDYFLMSITFTKSDKRGTK